MNQRQAKRLACRSAREMLEGYAPLIEGVEGEDYRRLSRAWDELLDELFERGLEKKEAPDAD